ncbi:TRANSCRIPTIONAL REGULATOR [Salix koriyanagi]|uniref:TRANSCRIPTIONAL REGULATOR n=1 Tax=Salix koriyanagi TaxID=2511006 RepID=A0A9Q0SYN1_9ROSI|nr:TRANSCRIPTIONAL REGULATOR [Salix koriyanagi]
MRKYGCLTIAGQHEFSSISLKLEHLLANVEQAPSRSMQDALLPPMKALISSAILRHLDEDVRVAVASCMSEIARITAPDAPYNDDLMKEIFQLTVASFEKLSHESGHCYTKAVSILENVARVRSCLMMLDLELDELILDMFQYFLKFIRSNHPQIAILAMETIMTLVIDESEEISVEILTLLLASVKKQNQSFSPIAWKLGERVITNCAAKIKPYLKEAMQSAGIPLDEYAPIVVSIFQDESHTLKCDYSNHSREPLGLSPNAACRKEVLEGKDVIPKSIASNGTASTRNAGTIKKDNASKILEPCSDIEHSKSTEAQDKAEPEAMLEMEPKAVPRKRGWKPNSLMNPEEGYDTWFSTARKTTKLPHENHEKGNDDLPPETSVSKKVVLPLMHMKVTKPTGFTPQNDQISGSSPLTQQQGIPAGSHFKRGRPKKKGISVSEDADPSPLLLSKHESLSAQVEVKAPEFDGAISSKKSKVLSEPEEMPCVVSSKKSKVLGEPEEMPRVVSSKKSKVLGEPEEMSRVVSSKKSKVLGEPEEMPRVVSSKKSKVPSNKKRSLDVTSDEDVREAFKDKKIKSLDMDGSYQEETPQPKLKRRRTPRKEVFSGTPGLGEHLVGSKIKVWWPIDKRFYEGVVDSYDPIKKKHKVLYADGDEEKLNLKRQRWEFIEDGILKVQGQEIDVPKPGTSSDMLQKVKSKTKSESRKKLKTVSSSKRSRAASISKTTARRFSGKSAYGAVHDEPICVDKPVDHDTSGPGGGSEDGKNTPGSGGGSKDDGEKSAVKLKIHDPRRIDSNSKQAMPETVNPSNNGSPKAGTVSCSFNSDQTMPVGATLSKDEISEGGDESHGSDGPKREQQGEAGSSLSPETD